MRWLIVILLVLAGCGEFGKDFKKELRSHRGSPVYIQDTRTGLCFAQYSHGHHEGYAHVPCSPEVMKLIKK